ncbi:hypothetical protein BaRGS_00036536, partial [Batillaria attramentaria]
MAAEPETVGRVTSPRAHRGHRVYRMLLTDFSPQAVLLTGRAGSGKTYAARSLVSQLMREARLSPMFGLGPRIVMAQHVLQTLVSTYCPGSPLSTRAIKMTTLYCRSDGHFVSGEVCALCLDKWRLVERPPGCGSFSIFYAMLGGLSDVDTQKYYLIDRYRLLDRNDGTPLFLGPDDHGRHVDVFQFFMTAVEQLGLDIPIRNYAGHEMSAVLALLAAILHLGNVHFAAHPQTGQAGVANHHELRAVADLLSVRPDQLEAGLMFNTTVVRGEMVQVPCTAEQSCWKRDSTAVEIYRRMISVLIGRVNVALMPQPQNVDFGALTPVAVIESPAHEDLQINRLETFLRNMAAERIERHLHDVIFQRDVEACEKERVQAYKIKFADNAELINMTFRVAYNASDFLSRNHGVLQENIRQVLLHSGNPLVATLAGVTFQSKGFPPEHLPPESFYATNLVQSDISYLMQRVECCNLHYIRCLRPNSDLTSPRFDQAEVTSQLKEACVVEVTRQRKFGYSNSMTQQDFVRSFRSIAFSSSATITSLSDACSAILEKAGLEGRGSGGDQNIVLMKAAGSADEGGEWGAVVLMKAASGGAVVLMKAASGGAVVFLRYWHVQKLHALKADDMRRVIIVQSVARRFLVRRRLGGRMTSGQQAAAVDQFSDYVTQAGAWAFHTVQEQADHDRNRFEGRLQNLRRSGLHHTPRYGDDHLNGRSGAVDPYTGEMYDNSDPPDDEQLFYDHVVERVLESLDSISEATWAKIIYMERERQVAKVYVESRAVIVDGSNAAFDGERFGLGACRNQYRDEESAYHRAFIHEGVRLKRDPDGNVWACRLCDQPIIVKGQNKPDASCLSADVLLCKGKLPQEQTIKIFDMKEFRSMIALDLKQGRFSRPRLRRACTIGLSFGRDDVRDLETACWLCVVNVKALHALDSDEIVREAQLQKVQMEMTSTEERVMKFVEDDARRRVARSRWARTDQRDHLQEKEAGARHMRQELRAKGVSVGETVGYSWETTGPEKTTMGALQQWVEPELHL